MYFLFNHPVETQMTDVDLNKFRIIEATPLDAGKPPMVAFPQAAAQNAPSPAPEAPLTNTQNAPSHVSLHHTPETTTTHTPDLTTTNTQTQDHAKANILTHTPAHDTTHTQPHTPNDAPTHTTFTDTASNNSSTLCVENEKNNQTLILELSLSIDGDIYCKTNRYIPRFKRHVREQLPEVKGVQKELQTIELAAIQRAKEEGKEFAQETFRTGREEMIDIRKDHKYPPWVRQDLVKRIRNLMCVENARDMILNGFPPVEVARYIQAAGELVDMDINNLKEHVEHYRATIPKHLMLAKVSPRELISIKREADRKLDVLERMTKLYEWMEERIGIMMTNDKKFNIASQGGEKNFAVATQMLLYIKQEQEALGLAGEHGPNRNAPRIDHESWNKVYGRESVAKIMSDPGKRNKVVRVAERLLDLYSQNLTPEQLAAKENKESLQDEEAELPSDQT